MTSQGKTTSWILQKLASALDDLSQDELAKLLDDSYSIEIKITRKRTQEERPTSAHEVDIHLIIEQLTSCASREDAQIFLVNNHPTKKSLELIARKLDIPIIRQDTLVVLRDKVIEATVGARMRSQAIQGEGV
jgi:hypothetical protein